MKKQLQDDLKQAMVNKDSLAKGVIQLVKARIELLEKEKGELTESQMQDVIRTELKQLDQTEQFAIKAARTDMLKDIKYKREFLLKYLPPQLSYDEIFNKVSEMVDVDATFGDNMKRISKELEGVAEKRLVSQSLKFYF